MVLTTYHYVKQTEVKTYVLVFLKKNYKVSEVCHSYPAYELHFWDYYDDLDEYPQTRSSNSKNHNKRTWSGPNNLKYGCCCKEKIRKDKPLLVPQRAILTQGFFTHSLTYQHRRCSFSCYVKCFHWQKQKSSLKYAGYEWQTSMVYYWVCRVETPTIGSRPCWLWHWTPFYSITLLF